MLKIVGKASSINVRKVLWTCAEIGLPFEREEWNDAAHAFLNPNRMVPVLVDGDAVLWESNTICRYLCTQYDGAALLPRAAAPRAQVEQWMDWQATELNTAWRYAFMALVRQSPAHADAVQIDASSASWNRHMGILNDQLGKTGAYVAGAGFTLADIVLGLSTNRWLMTPMARPDYPHVAAWLEKLEARAACRLYGRDGTP